MQDPFTCYETGLRHLLARIGKEHPRYHDALSLEAQLRENIAQARVEGDTENRRADRNRIVGQLNRLALEATGCDFNALCSAPGDESLTGPGPGQAPCLVHRIGFLRGIASRFAGKGPRLPPKGLHPLVWFGTVSYTHLTLPTTYSV